MARIRVATKIEPMWEILLSLHLLRKPDGAVVFGPWKRLVRPKLTSPVRMLFDLAPPTGYSPDFLTPAPHLARLEPGIDAVLSTPRQRLRDDLSHLAAERRTPSWTRLLADGDGTTLQRLGTSLRTYFHTALRPHWEMVRAAFEADRALRARAVLDGGSEHMLASLHPSLRWQAPVLTVASRFDRDVHLDGRGLVLVPSFFCWRDPITLRDPELPPVIVYPITHELGWSQDGGTGSTGGTGGAVAPLHTLLGRTRARALDAIAAAGGGSTTELAQRLAVSAAAVSQHVAVLRETGLVVTLRRGQSVHHSATPLGVALLDGRRRIPGPAGAAAGEAPRLQEV